MRFITFEQDSRVRAGVLSGDGSADDAVFDLAHDDMQGALGGVVPDMGRMIAAGLPGLVQDITEHGLQPGARLRLGDLRLMPPLVDPGHIYGAAFNYKDALRERGMEPPTEPVLFDKHASTLIASGEAVVLPESIGGVTYEAELAVVIGAGGENIKREDALSHVCGYACFNDISASAMIKAEGSFARGKNLPTFGPFGPYLASADEIPDPQNLRIWLTQGGEKLQDQSTSEMLFTVVDLIAILSAKAPLMPGDVIATGTPAGVAPARTPPTWLRPGTDLAMQVEGLGTLTNPVVEGAPLND